VRDLVLENFGQKAFTSFEFKQKYINRYKNLPDFKEREHLHFYLLVKAGMFIRMTRGTFILSPGYQFVTDEQVRELNRINSYNSLLRRRAELKLDIPDETEHAQVDVKEEVKEEIKEEVKIQEFNVEHAIQELKNRGYKISKIVTKYEEV